MGLDDQREISQIHFTELQHVLPLSTVIDKRKVSKYNFGRCSRPGSTLVKLGGVQKLNGQKELKFWRLCRNGALRLLAESEAVAVQDRRRGRRGRRGRQPVAMDEHRTSGRRTTTADRDVQ